MVALLLICILERFLRLVTPVSKVSPQVLAFDCLLFVIHKMSSSSSSSSTYEATFEYSVPSELFSEVKRKLQLYRTQSQPIGMTREDMSHHNKPSRRSTYDYSGSHHERGRSVSSRGGPAQPPPLPRAHTSSAVSSSSGYPASNVTGHRKCLDVEGCPPAHFFTSGDSKRYLQQGHAIRSSHSSQPSNGYHASRGNDHGHAMSNRYVVGNELVKYNGGRGGGSVAGTVYPDESVSQISSNGSGPSHYSGYPQRSGGHINHQSRTGHPRPAGSSTYGSNSSTYDGPVVWVPDRRYWTGERKPAGRGS